MLSPVLNICGSNRATVNLDPTMFVGGMAQIILGSDALIPTSTLTAQYLQRFCEGNPALTSLFKFDDFKKGGELFKYGMSKGIGNFGIAWDMFPARFYPKNDGKGTLVRVWPYVNG